MRMQAEPPAPTPDRLAALLRAAADPLRIRLLAALLEGDELCVCDLQARVRAPQATVSRHLSRLLRAGLVQQRRAGTWSYYRIAPGRDGARQAVLALVASLPEPGLHAAPRQVCR